VLPAGSGDDFASLLDCSDDPEELLRRVDEGLGARIDRVELGDTVMVNSAGLGFEAQVTDASRRLRWLRGRPLYIGATLRALWRPRAARFSLRTPEDRFEGPLFMISLGNGVSAGGGIRLTPRAWPDDGRISVNLVRPIGRLRALWLLPLAVAGRHEGRPEVLCWETDRLELACLDPAHLHVDGEYLGCRSWRFRLRVRPRWLPVLGVGPKARLSRPLEKIL
jgi:diacylglycerol kinase (ATP)